MSVRSRIAPTAPKARRWRRLVLVRRVWQTWPVHVLPERLRFDAGSAACFVYTYADGLLSAFAHDLAIRVTRFTLDVDGVTGAITATFDASSLRVVGAMRAGATVPAPLAEGDRATIERTIRESILDSGRHPEVTFASSRVTFAGTELRIDGDVTIRGRRHAISTHARPAGDALVAETMLHTPSVGIAPFTAMFGTLRVEPDVRVRVTVPQGR